MSDEQTDIDQLAELWTATLSDYQRELDRADALAAVVERWHPIIYMTSLVTLDVNRPTMAQWWERFEDLVDALPREDYTKPKGFVLNVESAGDLLPPETGDAEDEE